MGGRVAARGLTFGKRVEVNIVNGRGNELEEELCGSKSGNASSNGEKAAYQEGNSARKKRQVLNIHEPGEHIVGREFAQVGQVSRRKS